jgi:hypothetical protein
MQQLEFDLSDGTPTRQLHTFVGTTSKTISLDPAEYRGMSVPAITEEIKNVLRSIAPDVSFYEQDVVEAAILVAPL